MAMLRNLWRNKAFLLMALPGTIWLILFFIFRYSGMLCHLKISTIQVADFFKACGKARGLGLITLSFYFLPIMLT